MYNNNTNNNNTTTEDLLYASIGVKHCFVSNKLLK